MEEASAAAGSALPSPGRRRRRRTPRSSPNPLFTLWLREWKEQAAGTRAAKAYERALRSLALYPLPLSSGSAAAILKHFGPRLCHRLQQRLRRHRAEQGLPPSPPTRTEAQTGSDVTTTTQACPPRDYKPRPRSRGFALLLALLKSSEPIRAEELLQLAQPLCDLPLSPVSDTSKDQYSLTPRGRLLALQLVETSPQALPSTELPLLEDEGSDLPSAPGPFTLQPGSYDLILCADVTEECGGGRLRGLVPALLSRSRQVLRRRLPVGDFLWVARERNPVPGRAPRELVLDWVVERKTASDLGSSICDGRYREQKFRLGRCGLRCPIYLLEMPSRGQQLPVPLRTLRQAAASTQIGVYWCILVCTGVHWYVLVCTAVRWCVLVCTGMYWCALLCAGVYWCTLVCAGVYWYVLVCTGVCWCVLVYTGMYWCALCIPVRTGVYWCAPVRTGAYRCVPVCTGVYRCVSDGFLLRWTKGPEHSAAFLAALGDGLQRRYSGRPLQAWLGDLDGRGPPELPPPGVPCPLLTWDRLREEGAKSRPQTVGEVFARQLLQVRGVSPGVARGVLSCFPTPASLLEALRNCKDPQEGEKLLGALPRDPPNRSLGPALGRTLAQLYGTLGPLS
ncbi:crossover junction endonuclease MUS81 [Indicator indicator]|uniref:crossover junction endonuclease MUS81 n=1 Tax=Indicator indicator TaxID=1002788 RepID=UPI0023DF9EAC|nr:crossover junction endonuclease MUS81 [Indicator indicator]